MTTKRSQHRHRRPHRNGRNSTPLLAVAMLAVVSLVSAGEVSIEAGSLTRQGDGRWRADVTLRHADQGWDHYADAWRLVGEHGDVYGTRTLLHPHVDEQPFTRSLSGIVIPPGVTRVVIEAHDKLHGWAAGRMTLEVPATP